MLECKVLVEETKTFLKIFRKYSSKCQKRCTHDMNAELPVGNAKFNLSDKGVCLTAVTDLQ